MARRLQRRPITDSEVVRVCMYGAWGAPYAKYICRRVYGNGNPRYIVTSGDLARVYRILRRNGISLRDWRNGQTDEAERFFNRLSRVPLKAAPGLKLRVA